MASAGASAVHPTPEPLFYHTRPGYFPIPAHHARNAYRPHSPSPAPAPAHHVEPTDYQYDFSVQDEYRNVNFDASQYRDGKATNGGYRVALPDGRIQTVTYTVADDYSGYVADVKYEGEATYYEHPQPSYYQTAYQQGTPYHHHHQPAYHHA